MLIIPVSRRPDWRNPPLITLLLILVNALIFFGLQGNDTQRVAKAYRYYLESTLPQIELPRYASDLERRGEHKKADEIGAAIQSARWSSGLRLMEADRPFMKRLQEGQIVPSDDAEYAAWRRQRAEFDRLKNASLLERYGFKPAQPTLSGFFGNMFLHGGFDHLLGNMAILFMVGYMVEEALGKRRFLAYYLVGGMGATALDWLVNADRVVPGIGASGAISGVMAMFVALYGMRKIRFFYWAFIYFDFFKAPAIIMLPVWMANEIYQYAFNHGSMVNYMAHLGGFITGGALIGLQRRLGKQRIEAPDQEAAADPWPGQLARVDTLLGDLRIDEALTALRRLARNHPDDLAILGRYYTVARHNPASDDFHHAAALIFALTDRHPAADGLVHDAYVEYLKLAKPSVRFSVRQLIVLIRRLGRTGHVGDAERLTRVLARRAPQEAQLPGLLLLVAEAFHRSGDTAMRDATLLRLQQEYPGSDEARSATALTG